MFLSFSLIHLKIISWFWYCSWCLLQSKVDPFCIARACEGFLPLLLRKQYPERQLKIAAVLFGFGSALNIGTLVAAAERRETPIEMLKLEEQKYLGEASCALSEIVSKANMSLTLDLVQREEYVPSTYSQHRGKFTVHAEECFSSKTTTKMTLKCLNLESKDLFSKSVCIADFIFS
ncbi:hypothetical protein GQ457_06G041380 [Hibiscus cannabinus]